MEGHIVTLVFDLWQRSHCYREEWQFNDRAGSADANDRFTFGWQLEAAFDVNSDAGLTGIAHSSSTLTVEFFHGLDGNAADESFALDNVSVTLIPEPGAMALLALAGVGMILRRRSR